MYICLCNGITDSQIRGAVCEGADSLGVLRICLGVASNCGRCAEFAQQVLQETLAGGAARAQLQAA